MDDYYAFTSTSSGSTGGGSGCGCSGRMFWLTAILLLLWLFIRSNC